MRNIINDDSPRKPQGEAGIKTLLRMNDEHAPLRELGFSVIDFKPGMRILDVGCGGGMTIKEMLGKTAGSHISGIDFSETCVEQSEKENQEFIGSRVDIKQADAADIPYEDNSFDLVTAVETIYFWPDIKKAFSEIKRVLKPSGKFVIMNDGSDPSILNEWPEIEGFMKVYTPEELIELFRDCGFASSGIKHGDGQRIAAYTKK